MWYKNGVRIVLLIVALLIGGVVISNHLYGGDGCCSPSRQQKTDQDKAKDETQSIDTEKALSPDQMLKQADALQSRLEKTKNDKTLKEKCQKEIMALSYKMIQSAQEMVAKCSAMLKGENPDIQKITDLTNQSNELLKKSLEMIPQDCIMMSADKKNTASKDQYICPMGCIQPVDKPGKCPKCGMNLEKKK